MLSRAKNAVRNETVRIAAARPFYSLSDDRLNRPIVSCLVGYITHGCIVSASDYSRCVPVRRLVETLHLKIFLYFYRMVVSTVPWPNVCRV